ncbi:DNA pilot protein [robinz microvirus RP_45]|nr:DNA pilot protein [robinz microvirus RP_45]
MLGELIKAGASIAGGLIGASNAKRQEKVQREFAQNSIQWRAADAEKAGISKVFAMGAPTVSYSPQSVGDYGISDAGKALSTAIPGQGGPGSTTGGKLSGISSEIQAAQLDGLKIDNAIKRAELASKISIATQPGAAHVMDRDVIQGPEGLKLQKQQEPAGYGSGNKSFGVSPEVSMYRTKEGFAPQIPQQLQEAFESDALSRWQWNLRNKLLPFANMDAYGTPPHEAASNHYWTYDPVMGQYVHVKRGGNIRGSGPDKWEYLMDRLRR